MFGPGERFAWLGWLVYKLRGLYCSVWYVVGRAKWTFLRKYCDYYDDED
jgi:hypothetical protein